MIVLKVCTYIIGANAASGGGGAGLGAVVALGRGKGSFGGIRRLTND
jgi:hypothetical protein